MEVRSINIIGSGNVASYFVHVLKGTGLIKSLYSRNKEAAMDWIKDTSIIVTDDLNELSPEVDLVIVCVKDDAILEVIQSLPRNLSVVHTSGASDISILKQFKNHGVVWPLQSISKGSLESLSEVPFLIEASSVSFKSSLLEFARRYFSENSIEADSDQRLKIHLAAVFANNFSNFLLIKSKEILDSEKIDFKILKPLMIETIRKAFDIGPVGSQTGPALRNDNNTILQHLSIISETSTKDLYKLITKHIQETYKR